MYNHIESNGQGLPGGDSSQAQETKKTEILSKDELNARATKVLLLYAERAIYPLYDKVRRGEGKQILSTTEEGRPGEELLDIDQTGENVLKSAIREAKLPAILISENSPEPHVFGNGDSGNEKVYVFADPFDNTSQYKRGLDTPPYTVVSIWDKDGNPIGAVVGDIKDRKAYISIGKETFIIDIKERISEKEKYADKKVALLENQRGLLENMINLSTQINLGNKNVTEEQLAKANGDYAYSKEAFSKLEQDSVKAQGEEHKRVTITKSDRTTLKDRNSTLATFVGEKEYSAKFFKYFGKLVNDMHPKGLLYTGGGAYIYGLLASGSVDAYVMFDEPVSEIIPGLPLALAAGCTVVSVNEDGTHNDFKFDPNALREDHKLYSEGSVHLFIAAATPGVRDEIITAYVKAKSETLEAEKTKKELDQELTGLREFKNSRPKEEFEVFSNSQQSKNSVSN
jgi:fructose-1,6-bisphosphatase/inositol monophosphatase family enzyme